jgi:hypothetical protein
MYPDGKSEVTPVILPDFTPVIVDVAKLVDALTVVLKRSAPVKLQLVNTDPDRFVPAKSKEAGNVSEVYVFPWPTTTIVIRALLMISV